LTLRGADFLGAPVAAAGQAGPRGSALVVPAPYFWAAALCLVVLAAAAVSLPYLAWRWWVLRGQEYRQLRLQGGPRTGAAAPSTAERARSGRLKSIAGTWARARLTDEASPVAGWLLVTIAVLVIACCVAYGALGSSWLAEHASWLVTAGSFAIGTGAVALVAVGRSAYRNSGLRRTVGILWDVGTFWPRATHPLAPPCYTERIMPDLLQRITWLAPGDGDVVVVSAHSQGSVIAAALVLQLEPEQRRRVRLLTYGSPLRRTNARYFPAYFGPLALHRVGELLSSGQPAVQQPAMRAAWPWRNLFRPSDPVGGAIFRVYPISDTDNGDVDWQLMDPAIDPPPGDRAWPRTYAHSDYFRDPAFAAARRRLEEWPAVPAVPAVPRQ
ncbi:MAG TPA: hypothetical protein VE776_06160, partial [Actinomycetota bacterium]|nr:hypothetical protein [Actinomycetota bacterium]